MRKPCTVCSGFEQLVMNSLLMLDLFGNALMAGDPRETISRRTARARAAGSRAATRFCAVLTWCGKRLGQDRDHCSWALDNSVPSIGAEVWHWSPPVPEQPSNHD